MTQRTRFTRHRDGWPRAEEARASRVALDLGFRSVLLPRANGWTDIVGPLYASGGAGSVETATVGGIVSRRGATGYGWADYLQDRGYHDPRNGYAWVMRARLDSVLGNWCGLMSRTKDVGTAQGWAWQRTNADALTVYHAAAYVSMGIPLSAVVDGTEHVMLGLWRTPANRLEFWVDGILLAAATMGTAPDYTAATGQIKILSSRDTPNIRGAVSFAAFARGNLSAGAAARISRSPELLMAPRSRRAALHAVGGTGGVNLSGNAAAQASAAADLGVQTTHELSGSAAGQAAANAALTVGDIVGTDDFARDPDGTLAHPPWIKTALAGVGNLSTLGGQLRGLSAGNSALYAYDAVPASADYTVSLDIQCGADADLNGSSVGVAGRYDGGAGAYYAARYAGASGAWVLEKYDLFGGGLSTLGAHAASMAAYASANLGLRMIGDQIALLVDGVAVIEVTDSAIAGAGRAGILAYTASAASWYGDNFVAVLAGGAGAVDLAAAAVAQPAASADLTLAVPIAGAGIALATAGGALAIGIPLAGAAAGQSDAPGVLTVTGNTDLAGNAEVQPAAGGGLHLTVPLSASAVAAALAAAGLTQGVPLAGDAAGSAQAPGELSVGVDLAGGDAAQAGASGTLTLNVSLAGNPIATAAASAGLTVAGSSYLAGDAVANPAASGVLTHGVPLAGAALTVSGAQGNLTRIVPLAGASASASLATGGLDLRVELAVDALVQALAGASLDVQGNAGLAGDAAAQAGAPATLTLRINLAADAVADAVAAGALAGDGTLAGVPGLIVSRRPRSWRAHGDARAWRVAPAARTWRAA